MDYPLIVIILSVGFLYTFMKCIGKYCKIAIEELLEERTIKIYLIDNDNKVLDTMRRRTIPRIGERISLEGAYAVEVITITHNWIHEDIIHLKIRRFE